MPKSGVSLAPTLLPPSPAAALKARRSREGAERDADLLATERFFGLEWTDQESIDLAALERELGLEWSESPEQVHATPETAFAIKRKASRREGKERDGTDGTTCKAHRDGITEICAERDGTGVLPLAADKATVGSEQEDGSPVLLHVYDVSEHAYVQWVNVMFAHRWSPLKFGGFFHVGVEVYGVEWTFGYCPVGPGVAFNEPRKHPAHHFRETLPVGRTTLSQKSVQTLMATLAGEYPGMSYSLLRKNCCHFAEDVIGRMGLGPIPAWVHRLASIGDQTAGVAETVLERAGIQHLSRSSTVVPPPCTQTVFTSV